MLATPTLPPRVARLRQGVQDELCRGNSHMILCLIQQAHYARLAHQVYSHNRDQPEMARKAEFLEAFATQTPIGIGTDELIVGSQRFNAFKRSGGGLNDAQRKEMDFHGNLGHVIIDYARVLRRGVTGLRADIDAMPNGTPEAARNRAAYGKSLDAFALFIKRHGVAAREASKQAGSRRRAELAAISDTCARLQTEPALTFPEALQLTWFTHLFLHAEGSAVAFSFGRIDQFLWPYLERDLESGRLAEEEAAEWLACFWLKCCEGDESQNLIVGGVDEASRNAENPLSLLCLQVAGNLLTWQPSVSVRVHTGTSPAFWDAALALCARGIGMPSFFNDPVVTRALESAGIPTRRARDWGIVGCYEATPQGDTYGSTTAGCLCLPELLTEFLDEGPGQDTFAGFYDAFKAALGSRYASALQDFETHWQTMCRDHVSPFESICLTGCLESGKAAEEGGARFNLYGVNILGLGTVVDSLHVIKRLVFDGKRISLSELCAQVRADFSDRALHESCRAAAEKFGTDSDATNRLAADLSGHLADLVLERPFGNGVQPYPGLFRFGADVQMRVAATPDGRRDGERVSYGAGPSVLARDTNPIGILHSVSHVANDRCACGNPLTLSLSRSDVQGAAGKRRIQDLVETFFGLGGFHLHINIVDADKLREAQARPEEHGDLMVRISGYSARFTTVDKQWQDAIIERTKRGM